MQMNANGIKEEEVIATRTLQVLDEHGELLRTAIVRIERPRERGEDEWQCRYQIVGLLDDRVWGGAIGIDGVQALQGVMVVLGGTLDGTLEGQAGRLRWEGSDNLGFPSPAEGPTSTP